MKKRQILKYKARETNYAIKKESISRKDKLEHVNFECPAYQVENAIVQFPILWPKGQQFV